jgi:uncharacterized Fe-S cluster-containing radical SAM superfamily enzyme
MSSLTTVQVETTNVCNSNCVFCPHSEFEEHGTMPDKLYAKIVNECVEVPTLEVFIPMGTGEPLCDPKILSRIFYARTVLDDRVIIRLFTNASFLDDPIVEYLSTVRNFQLHISLNGLRHETRHRLMGLDDAEHVLKMWQKARDLKMQVLATMIAHPSVDPVELAEFAQRGGRVISYANWSGRIWEPVGRVTHPRNCSRVAHHLFILYTGQVSLCCFDPFGTENFGDLTRNTVKEVWGSPRRQFADRNYLELCYKCVK